MPMGKGTYGSQVGRPKKKKRPSEMMPQSFPKPKAKKAEAPKARTGSFPTGRLKVNMKKMPPAVQKRLMEAMRKKK